MNDPGTSGTPSFLIGVDLGGHGVKGVLVSRSGELIAEVALFDLYEGEGVDAGKKSLAITVRLEPSDRTLTDAEIEALAKKLVDNVKKATGGVLRG